MNIFSRHELIKSHDGCILVLYIEKQTNEFAGEFLSSLNSRRKELQKDSIDYIKSYVTENFHDLKIDTIKIMLGSLLVASITYIAVDTSTSANPASTQVQRSNHVEQLKDQSSLKSSSGQQLKTQEQKYTKSVKTTPDISANTLALVNKTHSLPADYVPNNLVIPNVPSPNKSKTMMKQEAALALEALFARARQDNIELHAISGYRSYARQKEIFASNTVKYGSAAAANQFSAKPGQSEHQTGMAMDVSSQSVNLSLTQSFAHNREGIWLKENAPQYGFILRYPKGKESITGYQFEPWHIRYVGKSAAVAISNGNITMEEFLGKE